MVTFNGYSEPKAVKDLIHPTLNKLKIRYQTISKYNESKFKSHFDNIS
jgi:hypothetical protein